MISMLSYLFNIWIQSKNMIDRSLLAKKISSRNNAMMAICPCCGDKIFGRDLKLDRMDLSKINNYPFEVCYHNCKNNKSNKLTNLMNKHSLKLHLDADLRVRNVFSQASFTI